MKTIKIILSLLLIFPLFVLLSIETEDYKIMNYQLIGLAAYGAFVYIIAKYSTLFKK